MGSFYGVILEGEAELSMAGQKPTRLGRNDFVLIPAGDAFTMTSVPPPENGRMSEPLEVAPNAFHLGSADRPDVRMLIGYYAFGSDHAPLLTSLMPQLAIVRGERRLTTLVELLSDEARSERPGRDLVLGRLLDVMLIETFRATSGPTAAPGLLRGLADERLATALQLMHGEPARAWTIGELASEAALSRSTFFDRFRQEVGVAPMEYLLAWRMALAKDLLRVDDLGVGEVARRVGYSSASTFSVAFTRQVGVSPTRYASSREQATTERTDS